MPEGCGFTDPLRVGHLSVVSCKKFIILFPGHERFRKNLAEVTAVHGHLREKSNFFTLGTHYVLQTCDLCVHASLTPCA